MVKVNLNVNSNYEKNRLGDHRLYDHRTRRFLHLSGSHTTEGETYAWRGNLKQAMRLKDKAHQEGRPFPFATLRIPDRKSQEEYRASLSH